MTQTIRWDRDDAGIVTLTLDDPNQSANTMNADFVSSMGAVIDRLEQEKDSVTGVVITSAKKTFFAGGDLVDLGSAGPDDAQRISEFLGAIKNQQRRIEKLGRPVVSAINGAALGGGLEIALATHHRVALDAPSIKVGLPEVGLGLLPGAGGVTRTVRMLGINDAVAKVLLTGTRFSAKAAHEIGLVDETAQTPEELIAKSKAWIEANPEPVQPWDEKGFKIPGGSPASMAAVLPAMPATLRKQLKGAPNPGPRNIVAAAVEGAQVDIDTALRIETQYLVELATGQVSTNMIKGLFFDMQHVTKGGSRPAGYAQYSASKIAVVGAGLMGAGIAYCAAEAGAQVVLKDVTLEGAERGKAYSQKILDKAVAAGLIAESERDEILARILPTAENADLACADTVIEAVFEDPELKTKVFGEIESVVLPEALLCSNTSSLPITMLAGGVTRPEDFIGLHFFSPVEKMKLLEIVVGERTSDAAIAKAIDIALQIGKIPIVVNDSRGFFTSRVIRRFADEAIAMIGEGVAASSVEQAALQAGYPAGALALYDDLTLTLPRKIRDETKAATLAEGGTWVVHPADAVIDRMIDDFDRKGRSTGGGFYQYVDGRRTGLWPGLTDAFGSGKTSIPMNDMQERMLFAEAMDTVNCLDEGVLRSVEDANVGSILGIGFPAWTGGAIQYINGYPGGLTAFVARAHELADRYGDRFIPPSSLAERAEQNELISSPR